MTVSWIICARPITTSHPFTSSRLKEREGDKVKPVRDAFDNARGAIEIEVKDGVVTLDGRVPGLASKRLAGVLAWWVPGAAT